MLNLISSLKFYIFVILLISVSPIFGHRHRRHQHGRSSRKFLDDTFLDDKTIIDVPISCEQRCEAQFEADYQTEFGVFYADLHWFPIHPILTQSEQNLRTFCSFSYQRNSCLSQCNAKEESWTPLHHICVENLDDMIDVLPCLRASSDMDHCSETCARSARRYFRFSKERDLDQNSEESVESKIQETKSKGCFYQLCILECRSRSIEEHCSDSDIDKSKHFLKRYYSSDAFHDALSSSRVPGICHQLISQDSNHPHLESTKLEPLDEGMIREMRSKLDAELKKRSTKKNQ